MNLQALSDLVHDWPAKISYGTSGLVGGVSAISSEWVGVIIGGFGVVATLSITIYYKRKEDKWRTEIVAELAEIDMDSIRAMRSQNQGRGNPADADKLTSLDDRAQVLRDELAGL